MIEENFKKNFNEIKRHIEYYNKMIDLNKKFFESINRHSEYIMDNLSYLKRNICSLNDHNVISHEKYTEVIQKMENMDKLRYDLLRQSSNYNHIFLYFIGEVQGLLILNFLNENESYEEEELVEFGKWSNEIKWFTKEVLIQKI